MAAVYKAYQPAMERYVALKILPRHFANDPQFSSRFQREAKLLAQLQHPHILPVFDSGQEAGYAYIVMPYVRSGTLGDSLKGEPLPVHRVRQVITQVGDALNYAHGRGMIHRDVKPSNVLIDEGGNCLLTDFGLARMVEASVNLTASGTIMGTPAYMSPEQGSGAKIDSRSDIYSLGVILYEMVTGRVPYQAETPVAVIFKHIQDPLPPARKLNPDLPEPLERVILKTLSKNPADRYQSATDLVRAIQRAVPEAPVGPADAAWPTSEFADSDWSVERKREVRSATLPPKSKRMIPTWIWGLLGLAILAILALVGGLLLWRGVLGGQSTPVPPFGETAPGSLVPETGLPGASPSTQAPPGTAVATDAAPFPTLLPLSPSFPTFAPLQPEVTLVPGTLGTILSEEDFEDGRAQRVTSITGNWMILVDESGNAVHEIDNTSG